MKFDEQSSQLLIANKRVEELSRDLMIANEKVRKEELVKRIAISIVVIIGFFFLVR